MDTKSLDFEQKQLRYVLKEVKKGIIAATAEKEELDKNIDQWIKAYNDENVELFMQLVVGTDRQESLEKLLHVYHNAEKSPYFGRVDFTEKGEGEKQIYIGRGGITENNEMLVVDWRTPIANLYYDSHTGPASYNSPDGTIEGDMGLKRTYNIKNGELLDYYDADLITNDELLQEYLAKNADVVLRDIVATIQSDQNEIIRAEPWHSVIVQGVAGSGKTTVALHRLSYLIFNTEAKENHFCIIGTNRMFLNYISGMLPDLGVEHIRQSVLRDLLLYILFYSPDTKTVDASPEKTTLRFSKALSAFMDEYEQKLFMSEPLMLENECFLSIPEIEENFELRAHVPMLERAENFANLIEHRVKTRINGILSDIEHQYDEKVLESEDKKERDRLIDEKYIKLEETRKISKTLKRRYTAPLKKAKEAKIYCDFLTYLADSGLIDPAVCASTVRNIRKKTYDLYDLCALAYISCRLLPNARAKEYDHIVIDEAQDFGPTAFLTLTSCFPHARYTILGDIAQNIHGESGLASWEDITELFPSLFFRALTKSYRNTIEIADFANRVLKKIGTGYTITPVVRHGPEVVYERSSGFDESIVKTVNAIKNSSRQNGSCAIVCHDTALAEKVYDALKDTIDLNIIRDDTVHYEGGVIVTPVHAVKGLEFDTVIIFDAGEKSWTNDADTAKRLYVALTRALHELNIFYTGEATALLEE